MGRKIDKGTNDFESWCKKNGKELLLTEWNYEKNIHSPDSISYGSHSKISWKCSTCKHEWEAVLKSRTVLNAGCPKCASIKISTAQSIPSNQNNVESFCIAHQLERVLNEWDPQLNELSPHEVCRSSSKHKITWNCTKCGHQWKCTPNQRIRVTSDNDIHVSECPMCLKEKQTSFPEQAIYYYLHQLFPDTINGDKNATGMELDIYIPSINTAVEYDGYAWHKNLQKDLKKNALCLEKGIKLIRIRENGCPTMEENENCSILHVVPNNRDDLTGTINELCTLLGYSMDIDIQRDEPLIMSLYQKNKYENSLEHLYPKLCAEFHPSKNGMLHPRDINKRTARKIWWKCSICEHEWLATVSSRTSGHGCPACSGRALVYGKNDLETFCKETNNELLLKEWDYDRNPMKPSEVTKKNAHKAYWKCSICNTSYNATIHNRTNGGGCPVCAGKKVQSGINDFHTWCINNGKETLLNEWALDNKLLPDQVSHGSGIRISWICSSCGQRWVATLDNRKKGKGCPACGNIARKTTNIKTAMKNTQTLRESNPSLAQEWNYEKNLDEFIKNNFHPKTPDDCASGSNQKVWWKCIRGHEWKAIVYSRNKGSGCPYCSGKKVAKGFNDLKAKNPTLSLEWHPTKNGNLNPDEVTANSHKIAWWLCPICGHEWSCEIKARNQGRKCPACSKLPLK